MPARLPVRFERNAQVELPTFVRLQQLQELVLGEQLSVDDDTLGVDAAPDALEGHPPAH